jgi:hypothetical protein
MESTLRAGRVDRDVARYLRLLDDGCRESVLQDFLQTHAYFFHGLARHHAPIFSKVKFGAEYETDFAFFDPSSFGVEWNFVEIEGPSRKLFTKAGDPSAALTHAIQQVRDWNQWIHENLAYVRQLLPQIHYPFSWVIMGRRRDLNAVTRKKLQRINYDNRMILEIRTLDYLADLAAGSKNFGYRVPMQIRTYSHSQVARGEPRDVFEWLRDQNAPLNRFKNTREILRDRKRSLRDSPDD